MTKNEFIKEQTAYEKHLAKWQRARELVHRHNKDLIEQWNNIPWWRFWEKPSFEEQQSIILENWSEFNKLPVPRLMDYFPLKF